MKKYRFLENPSKGTLNHFFGDPIVPLSLLKRINKLTDDYFFFAQFSVDNVLENHLGLKENTFLYIFISSEGYPYSLFKIKIFHSSEAQEVVIDDYNFAFKELAIDKSLGFDFEVEDALSENYFEPEYDEEEQNITVLRYDPLSSPIKFLQNIDGVMNINVERKFKITKDEIKSVSIHLDYT